VKYGPNTDSRTPGELGTEASAPVGTSNPGFAGRTLKSTDLFGDSRELYIDHAGACYRLRVTQNNKLILTK
jgi:hemin uptake protein HemP